MLPPGLFPQGPATDALNTILQQAFQQAMATGSGVNVNVSLNTAAPAAPAAADAPSAAPDAPPAASSAPGAAPAPLSQMRVQVVPITQDIQTLMRDAFAQVTGAHVAPEPAPVPAPAPEAPEEDRAATALAGSMFTHLLNELREQDRTNPDGRLLDVVQRAYGTAAAAHAGDGEEEGEDEEGEEEATGPLDSLMREICSRLTTHDFVALLGRSEEAQCKVVCVARDALRREMGGATVDEYTARTMAALRQGFADSTLPAEVRERLRPGTSFAETLCATLQEPFADLCRTMGADSEPAQTLARVKAWAHASLVRVVDSLAAVLVGGVDDVQVIIRYFVYVVCLSHHAPPLSAHSPFPYPTPRARRAKSVRRCRSRCPTWSRRPSWPATTRTRPAPSPPRLLRLRLRLPPRPPRPRPSPSRSMLRPSFVPLVSTPTHTLHVLTHGHWCRTPCRLSRRCRRRCSPARHTTPC